VTRVDAPAGPWSLAGEFVVGVMRSRATDPALPPDLHRVPGPCLLMAARYDDSPVGPYLELAVSEPARLGARLGMCVTTMVVNTAEARHGGRANWGLPKELGTLDWSNEGDTRVLRWLERDVVVRATPIGPPLPTFMPFRTLQHRGDGPVCATAQVRGRGRTAKVALSVPADDPWAARAGTHLGAVISSARLVMGEAEAWCPPAPRRPRRALRQAPEPALSWEAHQGD